MDFDAKVQQLMAAGILDADRKVKEEKPVLLVTTVDIGEGKNDTIEVRRGDNPEDVARAFCEKHGLGLNILPPLVAHINDNLRKAKIDPLQKTPESQASDGDGRQPPTSVGSNGQPAAADGHLPSGAKQKLNFNNGMDDRLIEQLSSKLMSVDDADAVRNSNRSNVYVNAAEELSGAGGGRASRSQQPQRSGGSVRPGSAGASPRHSVHMRLYGVAHDRQTRLEERQRMAAAEKEDHIRKGRTSMSCISAQLMEGRGPGPYENYGEMLYAEGLECWMARSKKAELELKARKEKELEGVTFAPAITKKAWDLKMRESSDLSAADEKWDRLHARGISKSTLERLEDLRRQRAVAETAECTFRPKINKSSDAMMSERSETLKVLNISHYDQLFQDALRRQAKMEELQNWYPDDVTFQPQVNKDRLAMEHLRRSYEKMGPQHRPRSSGSGGPGATTSAGNTQDTATRASVVDRLYAVLEQKKQRQEELQQMYNGNVDPVTGRTLYRPEVGRAPRSGTRAKGMPIGEYLYTAAIEQSSKRAAAEEEVHRQAEEEACKSRTTVTSQKLYVQLKVKRFEQVFAYLDERGAGFVDLVEVMGLTPDAAAASPDAAAAPAARSERVDNLDNEVLMDVELAAALWARANGMDVPLPVLPSAASPRLGSAPTSPGAPGAPPIGSTSTTSGPPPPVDLSQFMVLMDQAISMRPRPRAYLVPSPAVKQQQQHSFKPQINKRSKQIAAKLRPADSSAYEVLHQFAAQKQEKLEARRKEQADAQLVGCTFAPQLNEAMKGVQGRALSMAQGRHLQFRIPVDGAPAVAAAAQEAPPAEQSSEQWEAQELHQLLEQELRDLSAATELSMRRLQGVVSGASSGGGAAAAAAVAAAAAAAAGSVSASRSASSVASRRDTREGPSPMVGLAQALNDWDPSADPTMAGVPRC